MEKIVLKLRYKELCAIKHALDKGIERKKRGLFDTNIRNRDKALQEIIDEEKLSSQLEYLIRKNRMVHSS